MTPERHQRIGQLFDEALKRPPDKRSAYLEQVSGADTELRAEVEKLLASHSDSQESLSEPGTEVAAGLPARNHTRFRPGKQMSRYQILSLLGAGGMGEVYLAEDTRLKRKVALKVLPEVIGKDQVRADDSGQPWDEWVRASARLQAWLDRLSRFEQEAIAASALNHPNILTIYEFGAEGGAHFLAAEFVDGETVRSYLQHAPLEVEKALDIAIQAAQALDAAHRAGIVHRDIKPENVMIRNDGIVKVLDFGLAKLVESAPIESEDETGMQGVTQAGTIIGTVAYMSPEQARGTTLDARTDIFSLGVVLYEMITRRHPFMGETMNHTIVALLEKEPPPLGQVVKDVPAELEQIIDKALAKKADERYQTAAELLGDLKTLSKRLEFAAELARAQDAAPRESRDPGKHARGPGKVPEVENELPTQIIQARAALPERELSYSLTVQKYRDKTPYQQEFQSSGREIFEGGWGFKLNLVSAQEGFLYLLKEEPGDIHSLVFPWPWRNNGSAHLGARERLQSDWHFFDEQPGTERFRVVWAAEPVPQLESLRGFVNRTTNGLISHPTQVKAVREFLLQNEFSQIGREVDQQTKQTNVRWRSPVLVTLIELEHH
jgi:serine/threonine protein kinase